jgi:hypothetical protein
MLELSKNILGRVSFDKILFKKELSKAIRWLKKEEAMLLKVWCLANFGIYREVIMEVFKGLA